MTANSPDELEELGPADEVPELDLKVPSLAPPPMAKPRPQATSAAGQAPAAPAPRKAAAPVGVSFDDGMDMGGADLGSIELGGGTPGGMMGHVAPESTRADGPKSELPEWARISAVDPQKAPAMPKVAPLSSVMMSEDGGRAAARRLGDYGDAPSEWWKAPFYAYRVKMRQMELRKALAARRAELDLAHAATDDALVVLAERVRNTAMQKTAYAKLLDAVIVAENTLRERDSELAAATEAHKRQTAGLDAQITRLEAEMAGARAEEKSYLDVFERADAVRQRADAKVKRVDIELRAAVARANAGASAVPGLKADVGPSDPEVAARTAEREARLAELQQAMPAVTDASQKLTVARKRVTGIAQKMTTVKNERAGLEAQFKKRGAAHGAQVAAAQKEVRTATAALGRAVSLDHGTFGAEWTEARSEIAALDKATAARDDEVMLHVMALDAHDPKVVSSGLTVAVGAFVLLCALLAIPTVLAMMSSTPPPPAPAATE